MLVPMMRIRHMRMRVRNVLVAMPVCVGSRGHRIVNVRVVPLVVGVRMLMLDRFVGVLMRMRLG